MEKRKKVLIVGCGNQGCLNDAPGTGNEEKVISFARAFKERDAELYFRDVFTEKANKAAEIWGGINYIPSVKVNFDIIVIATPDDTHYLELRAALALEPKLVICEKPLCNNTIEAKEIIRMYKEKGIQILTNYTRRFIPELIELKERYDAGEFGYLYNATVDFNRGKLHTLTHALDFFNWFFDKQIFKPHYHISEHKTDYRVWSMQLFFEKFYWQEQRIFDMSVPSYFDLSTRYVAENAYAFLDKGDPLKCTAIDALKALEVLEERS